MRRGLRATAVLGCPRLSVSSSSLTASIIVGLGLIITHDNTGQVIQSAARPMLFAAPVTTVTPPPNRYILRKPLISCLRNPPHDSRPTLLENLLFPLFQRGLESYRENSHF